MSDESIVRDSLLKCLTPVPVKDAQLYKAVSYFYEYVVSCVMSAISIGINSVKIHWAGLKLIGGGAEAPVWFLQNALEGLTHRFGFR